MYTLIGFPKTRTLRVAWGLEELGLTYDWNPALPASPEARQHSPFGKVPVLLAEGSRLTGSAAILQFLADRHGGLTHPAGTLARAQQDAITDFVMTELDAVLWTAAKHSFVLPEDLRVAAVKPTCRYEFARAMEQLMTLKGDRPFLAGEDITVPDILLGHCANWAINAKFDPIAEDAAAFVETLRARPALKRAQQKGAALIG